jgi:hypothetical protein
MLAGRPGWNCSSRAGELPGGVRRARGPGRAWAGIAEGRRGAVLRVEARCSAGGKHEAGRRLGLHAKPDGTDERQAMDSRRAIAVARRK